MQWWEIRNGPSLREQEEHWHEVDMGTDHGKVVLVELPIDAHVHQQQNHPNEDEDSTDNVHSKAAFYLMEMAGKNKSYRG